MSRFGRWFLRRWFVGVFAIIGVVWVITEVAWLAGAKSITFGNRYGPPATIDFMREHDRPVLALGDGVGLRLRLDGDSIDGSIERYKPGPPVLCLVCGYHTSDGGVAPGITHRDGDWFYRAPRDESKSREAHEGRPESRAYILTIAYNRATGERVQVGADDSLDQQTKVLAQKGLVVTAEHGMGLDDLVDLQSLSVMSEGCAIFNLAFVAATLLWLLFGGLAAGIVRMRRRRSANRG